VILMTGTPPRTLRELLDAAGERGGSPALLCLRDEGAIESLSSGELAQRALALAGQLARAGVRRAEPVLVLGPNSAEWVIAYFGALCAGALPVVLDAQAGSADLAHAVRDSGARRALTTAPLAQRLRDSGCPSLAVTLFDALREAAGAALPAGVTAELPGLLPLPEPDDGAALFYTSGTTGLPKGVPLTHRNLMANVLALVRTRLVGAGDRVLLPLPLHHTYPFTCGLLGSLATGAALVLPAGVSGPQLVAAIRATEVSMLLGVPRLYSALLAGIEARAGATPLAKAAFGPALRGSAWLARRTGLRIGRVVFRRVHRDLGPSLRMLVSGGARLEPELAWRLEGLGWEVLSGYGLTETSPILTFNVRGEVRHAAVGRPLPGVELRIDAPAGEATGEILARGPGVFGGYLNDAEATRAAFTPDGWFRTGDVGYLDAQGYLHIVGRVKEIIVLPDGKKLVPEVVEQAYAASPLVREVALLEQQGRLVALVVPDEAAIRERGAARLASLLRDELEAVSLRLPRHQRVSDFRLSPEPLPRTPLGKLQRFRLPQVYAGERAAPAARAAPLSADDQALLGAPAGQQVWAWLGERFAGKPLSLDASPQLDLDVDSLEWVALTLEIRDRFGVELGQEAVARVLTVRDLVQAVLGGAATPAGGAPVREAPVRGTAPRGAGLRALGLVFYAINWLLMRVVFRLRVVGLHNLPAHGPLLIAPNHASYLDSMAIAAALPWRLWPELHWAGWSEFMFRAWHWRLLSRATGVFAVDANREPAAAIAAGCGVLAAGQVLTWFPEGRRTLNGEVGPFLPGVGLLLRESAAPVVPVRITGSFEALPWHRRWPRPLPITVVFGAPADFAGLAAAGTGSQDTERAASGLRAAVMGLEAGAG